MTAAALAALGAPAGAGTVVQFYVSGLCAVDCAKAGMNVGDTVEGNIQIDSANFTPGGAFTSADVPFFIFTFSDRWLEFPMPGNASPVGGWYAAGTWGQTNASLASLVFHGGTAYGGGYGTGIDIEFNAGGLNSIFASVNTICGSPACDTMNPIDGATTGPVNIVWEGEPGPGPVAPVPLPPAAAGAAAGLAGLGLLCWRRRMRPAG